MSSPPDSVLPQAPILYVGELVGAEPERAELRCGGPRAVEHTTLSAQWLESIRVAELRRRSRIDGQDKARTAGSNVEVSDFSASL
jgi:hypothetical protein